MTDGNSDTYIYDETTDSGPKNVREVDKPEHTIGWLKL
jgi:hypothetical protein